MSASHYEFSWTCISACQVLGVWPAADPDWITTVGRIRQEQIAQEAPVWTSEEGFTAAKIKSATEFLGHMTPEERMDAFKREIGERLAENLQVQLSQLFQGEKLTSPLP